MNSSIDDPFDAMHEIVDGPSAAPPDGPSAAFITALRARLLDALDLTVVDLVDDAVITSDIHLPDRTKHMNTDIQTDTPTDTPTRPYTGGIWASIVSPDAQALIRFYTDVLGFEADLVVPDESNAAPDIVVHSQLRWPEGGVVQISSTGRGDNVYSQRPAGAAALYVVTARPQDVWARCQAADVTVVDAPQTPDYAPGTMVFSVADPDGNIVSFGSYSGET